MCLEYVALVILIFVVLVLFYGIIAIHDIPYEIACSSGVAENRFNTSGLARIPTVMKNISPVTEFRSANHENSPNEKISSAKNMRIW